MSRLKAIEAEINKMKNEEQTTPKPASKTEDEC